ncbi:MAG: aminopeptidase P family protein [Candidatus Methanogaster sp.]|uniref:Aminopeptidase P family protein n=1 Tax=Candidatus Methanogaster sp. TaxID=3386292 RepID=A0AC61L412_9EURY|nr:MAG: aminopeptidase P family protein [ANME-2 cluster archaeon]
MTPTPYLMIDNSVYNQDMYYATRFLAPDQFSYLRSGDEEILMVPEMELGRARKESRISDIRTTADYRVIEKLKQHGRDHAQSMVISELLHDEGVTEVNVPHNFPVFLADELRDDGFKIIPIQSPVRELRSVKTREEIELIKKAQVCCEAAMHSAIDLIRRAEIRRGVLADSGSGQPLTSELVRTAIEHALIGCGCESEGTIVAGGKGAADPHNAGRGALQADESIVIDIFPRLKMERYYADMTRTVARGSPSRALFEMYAAVLDAQTAALRVVREGASGEEVHDAACGVFEDSGYRELFIHSTGHGVGLDVHETPHIGVGGEMLKAGNVITVEPGLYDHEIGGIRIEDMVVVTKYGCENLTTIGKGFLI